VSDGVARAASVSRAPRSFEASGESGVCARADVVATRLYQSAGRATVYKGPWHCAVVTLQAEGPAAFMRGWAPQMLRLGPHTILTFVALEEVKRALSTVPLLSREVPAPEEAALA